MDAAFYNSLLDDVKLRIRKSQIKAALSVNAELIALYFDIGRLISELQDEQVWGAAVTARLAKDIRNELPEIKGFSERNLFFMIQFYKEYYAPREFVKQLVSQIPWGHNILLMQKIKDIKTRLWYINQTVENGWSREYLGSMINQQLHLRQGGSINNFSSTLPDNESVLIKQTLKDPYIFDFITIAQSFTERELETELIKHVEKFLLELGAGFAFVGRQYKLMISNQDFYIDLLFYHLKIRCFFVIDLKRGDFRPEYAGKMNFYCSAVDDLVKHETDKPTIGLILCQTKDKIIAEYALRGIDKPIGISEFEITRSLPRNLRSSLPSIEEIENELTNPDSQNDSN